MSIALTADNSGALNLLNQVGALLPKAMARALNRGVSAGRTVMVRSMSRDMGLRASEVRSTMRMHDATPGNLEARLDSPRKRLGLLRFNAKGPIPSRGKGRGVTYRIGEGGRKRIPDAFIAPLKGKMAVMVRVGKARLPRMPLFGPSLGGVFAKYRDAGLERAEEQFQTTLTQELRYRARLQR